jgi:transcriptional regulator with XRE-family HTH domain
MHVAKASLPEEQSFYLLKLPEQMAAEELVAKEDKQENAEAKAPNGREEFVVRLSSALHAVGCEPNATKLVKAFNLRYPHESVTIQAARKWLLGEAFPSEPKLLALAHWLDVDPAWLRFGETEWHPNPDLSATFVDGLERDLAMLTTVERGLMRQMLDLILAGRASAKR